jgi:hypothetical protein
MLLGHAFEWFSPTSVPTEASKRATYRCFFIVTGETWSFHPGLTKS